MIIKPRYTILAGLLFVAIGVVYGLLSHDPIGVTLLLALGAGMALMSYVLIAGSPRGDEQ
jgi:VIT1/CCC1 family predicted Fe2+/Mn2+ transporter